MDLDDLIAEMTSGSPPPAQPSSSDSSSEDGGGKSFTLEDLDSLMAEVESSETSRRRQPALVDAKKIGARKTTTRKTVQGALSGQDLDSILDTIMGAASKKLDQHKSALGWGVVSTVSLNTNLTYFRKSALTILGQEIRSSCPGSYIRW